MRPGATVYCVFVTGGAARGNAALNVKRQG